MSYLRDNGFENMESLREELTAKKAKLSGVTDAKDIGRLSKDITRLQAILNTVSAVTTGRPHEYVL